MRRVLQLTLESFGNCDVVQNGQEALDFIGLRLAGESHYDLICLDLGLPDLEGVEVLRQIRILEAKGGKGARARIIIVTGSDDKDVVRAASKNGADAYLLKPVAKQQLLAARDGLGLRAGTTRATSHLEALEEVESMFEADRIAVPTLLRLIQRATNSVSRQSISDRQKA